MPLVQSNTQSAFEENLKREEAAGKPQKQALAIAYEVKRANDGEAIPVVPETVTPATINEENRKWWAVGPKE